MNRSALITCLSALGLGLLKQKNVGSSMRLAKGYAAEFKFFLSANLVSPISFENITDANRMWENYILPLRPVDLRKILDKNGLEDFNVFVLDYLDDLNPYYLDDLSEGSNLVVDFVFESEGVYVSSSIDGVGVQASEDRNSLLEKHFSKMKKVVGDIIDLLNRDYTVSLSVEDVNIKEHWTDTYHEIIVDLGTGKEYETPGSKYPKLRRK